MGANYRTAKQAKAAKPSAKDTKPAAKNPAQVMQEVSYSEDDIKSLDWREHIRLRPGMYIGKLGDGSSPDDGIYVLIKEVLDNCIDEYAMGYGKVIDISINEAGVTVRDYGRGIPLEARLKPAAAAEVTHPAKQGLVQAFSVYIDTLFV